MFVKQWSDLIYTHFHWIGIVGVVRVPLGRRRCLWMFSVRFAGVFAMGLLMSMSVKLEI